MFLGLSKAFEFINRNILKGKLQAVGVKGTPISWFESFQVFNQSE